LGPRTGLPFLISKKKIGPAPEIGFGGGGRRGQKFCHLFFVALLGTNYSEKKKKTQTWRLGPCFGVKGKSGGLRKKKKCFLCIVQGKLRRNVGGETFDPWGVLILSSIIRNKTTKKKTCSGKKKKKNTGGLELAKCGETNFFSVPRQVPEKKNGIFPHPTNGNQAGLIAAGPTGKQKLPRLSSRPKKKKTNSPGPLKTTGRPASVISFPKKNQKKKRRPLVRVFFLGTGARFSSQWGERFGGPRLFSWAKNIQNKKKKTKPKTIKQIPLYLPPSLVKLSQQPKQHVIDKKGVPFSKSWPPQKSPAPSPKGIFFPGGPAAAQPTRVSFFRVSRGATTTFSRTAPTPVRGQNLCEFGPGQKAETLSKGGEEKRVNKKKKKKTKKQR